jgi:hypothetical protein
VRTSRGTPRALGSSMTGLRLLPTLFMSALVASGAQAQTLALAAPEREFTSPDPSVERADAAPPPEAVATDAPSQPVSNPMPAASSEPATDRTRMGDPPPRHILNQFLIEATTLSAVGGLIGIGVGLLGAMGVARAIHVPFVIPGVATPVAFGVSVLVGIVFGVFPARKAARLNPLAALRYE